MQKVTVFIYQITDPIYRRDTCIDRYNYLLSVVLTINNICSQCSAPFINFVYFAFNFNDINSLFSVNWF